MSLNQVVKSVPYNIQAEHLLLGAILVNNNAFHDVQSFLLSEHFYDPLNQKIYKAIISIFEEGHVVSPVSLKSKLDPDESFQANGAENFLAQLTTLSMTVIRAEDYAEIIYDLALRRKLIGLGEEMLDKSYNSNLENLKTKEIIESTENSLFKLAMTGYVEKDFQSLKDVSDNSIKNIFRAYELHKSNQVVGVSTGFLDLDAKLGGFQNSDLIILAGRPGMGKTAFAINLALSAAEKFFQTSATSTKGTSKSVGIFSLEMSAEQLATRMISMHTSIDSLKLRSGNFRHEQHMNISSAAIHLGKLPFFIDDTAGITISAIRTRARKMYRQHNLGLIVIDYLQLIQSTGVSENRVLEVSEITKNLKILARELNIPIIALSQLSRGVDQRVDKRPLLSDLRESGSIEQDADLVMFIFREGYYASIGNNDENRKAAQENSNQPQQSNKKMDRTEIIVAKHRNGPIGSVDIYYDLASSKFSDIVKF
jgi:replicative DNA helicase